MKEVMKKIYKWIAVFVLVFALGFEVVRTVGVGAESNESKVFTLLISKYGYNNAAASGIMANIYHESSFNPRAVSGPSIGLCQWLGGRKSNMFSYAKSLGYSGYSVEGQVAFLDHELKTGYSSLYSELKSTSNTAQGAYSAAYNFCYKFERPANKAARSAQRGNSAKNTYYPRYKDKGAVTNLESDSSAAADETSTYTRGTYQTRLAMNVRASANKNAKVVGYVSGGSSIKVLSVKNKKWGKIKYNGKTAYVSLKYSTKAN